MTPRDAGPDVVIAGSARSGSTFLSALLDQHPGIALASVKEPEYFNFKWEQGPEWYDGLYPPRETGLLRLDATVSYTFPEAGPALERVAEASPAAEMIYLVRDPVARLVSQFLHFRDYVGIETAADLGQALEHSPYGYLAASDYRHWIERLVGLFGVERVLVVPLPALSVQTDDVVGLVVDRLGLAPAPIDATRVESFRNALAQPRNEVAGRVVRRALSSRAYPHVRRAIGPDRLRRVRRMLTTSPPTSGEGETASLTPAQRAQVNELSNDAAAFVTGWLREQDDRLGVAWSTHWEPSSWAPW